MRRIVVRTGAPATTATVTFAHPDHVRLCGTCYARIGEPCRNIAGGGLMPGVHAMRMPAERTP